MKSGLALSAYALAYVNSVPKDGDAIAEFDQVVDVLAQVPQLQSFVGDTTVRVDERRKALAVASPKALEMTLNLVCVLARDGRLSDISLVATEIRKAVAAQEEKKHAIVTSVIPLTAKDLKRIEDALAKITGAYVKLETQTDPTLLSGLRVSMGDWVFDASLKGRLARLHHALTL